MRLAILVLVLVLLAPSAAVADLPGDARAQMAAGRYDEAYKAIQAELKSDPRSWRGYQALGEYLVQTRAPEKALKAYLRAWSNAAASRILPEHKAEHQKLGQSLDQMLAGAAKKAGPEGWEPIVESALANHFVPMPLVYQLVERYAARRDWEPLLKVMQKVHRDSRLAVGATPQLEGSLCQLEAQAMESRGDLLAALQLLRQARDRGIPQISTDYLEQELTSRVAPVLAQADEALASSDYTTARKLYQQALVKAPVPKVESQAKAGLKKVDGHLDELRAEADSACKSNDYAKAGKLVQSALAIAPQDSSFLDMSKQIEGRSAEYRKQRQEEQKQLVQRATQARPKEAIELLEKARAIGPTEEIDRLLKTNRRQSDLQSNYDDGMANFKAGNYSDAVASLQKVVALDSTYNEAAVQKTLALSYLKLDLTDEFVEIAEGYFGKRDDTDILKGLAAVYRKKKDTLKAMSVRDRLKALVGHDPSAASAAGPSFVWELPGRRDLALGGVGLLLGCFLLFLLTMGGRRKTNRLAKLEALMKSGDFKAAVALHPKLLDDLSDTETLTAQAHFARAFYETRDYQKAEVECQAVLQRSADNKAVQVIQARIYYLNRMITEEALGSYVELFKSDQWNLELLEFITSYCLKRDVTDPTVLPVLRAAAKSKPGDEPIRRQLVRVYAKARMRNKEALAAFEAERTANPGNADIRAILVEHTLAKGNAEAAIKEALEILQVSPRHDRTHELLRDAHTRADRLPDLVAYYKTQLQRLPEDEYLNGLLAKVMSMARRSTGKSAIVGGKEPRLAIAAKMPSQPIATPQQPAAETQQQRTAAPQPVDTTLPARPAAGGWAGAETQEMAPAARTEALRACSGCGRPLDPRHEACTACGQKPGSSGDDIFDTNGSHTSVQRVLSHPRFVQRYEIVRSIGKGGMAEVFEATDKQYGRKVAIKIVTESSAAHRGRFEREGKVLARLAHPCLLSVFGAELFDDIPVLVMELLEGQTLKSDLSAIGRYSPARAVQVVGQALEGLEVAHRAGIVHRDMKPDNIFLLKSGMVKILDFGLARPGEKIAGADLVTSEGMLVGTPAYMSPEQCTGGVVDERSDLYAMGVILFQLLTGQCPFSGAHTLDLLNKHINESPRRPSSLVSAVPEHLDLAVLKALAKAPADRFQDARSFSEALRQ